MKWTEAEIATLKRMCGAGYTDLSIGDHLGRSKNQITWKRLSLGLRSGVSREHQTALARVNLRRARNRRLTF